jgi:aldehyde dehydrogenase (NAD+)
VIAGRKIVNEYNLFIGGKFVEAIDGRRFASVNPANQTPVATAARASAADATRAVSAALEAFERGPWARMPRQERSGYLKAVADRIGQERRHLVELEVADSGSTVRKAREDVYLSSRNLQGFARLGTMDLGGPLNDVSRPGVSHNVLFREPIGVVAAIIPWNFPLKMAIWKLGPALAAGNTLVLKPSEETPVTAMELARIVSEVGLPPGVVNIVTGFGPEAGAALVKDPRVGKVAFTGSTAVGRNIMRDAAATLKNVTLECGGKSANIVLEDADPSIAIDGALYAAFYHQGQCCEAGSRLLLPERNADGFVEALVDKARRLTMGDPAAASTDLGPLISKKRQETVLEYISLGATSGARLLTGGRVPAAPELAGGFYVEPTIFDFVDNQSTIAQEEIFGPVLCIIRYRSVEEAIALANDTVYGLAGGVWSRDPERALNVARELRAGTVWINEWHLLHEAAPFGGYKQSGIGREFGSDGLREYTEAKHIHVDEAGTRDKKHWYDTVVKRQ